MNEWEFTADVESWINVILSKNISLPFSRAKCEQSVKGSLKRRDLTLLDKNQRVVLTGEVKLPYRKDGGSPYNAAVVSDARAKAQRAGTRFFFTWNVNEFVLWETTPSKMSWQEQNYKSWVVTTIHRESHLELPMTAQAIKTWLALFLNEFAQIIRGAASISFKAPDEKFIEALESSLQMPIVLNLEKLDELYKKPSFKSELDKWMREEQGWLIFTDPEGIRDNLERASKFACYALINKLVFHEALLKRYAASMSKLSVPEHIDTGEALRLHLEGYFAEAKSVTEDYETVFGEDHASIGNRIPFYSDSAVPHWRELLNKIHEFDFSKLDYEIIGSMFERLIAPEERSKFGQFYTRVEVVDLINSFCIRNGLEKVMDPACGGGTFLVRAYARKRELKPARKHGELLSDIFGVDKSHFATHLTTINLATRDLIDAENYPQIARSDFFDIEASRTFLTLPSHAKAEGLGKTQRRDLKIPSLDAVVGNPPYLRQEDITGGAKKKGKRGPKRGTKEYYQMLVLKESGAKLSGRSDIHCYFWPHAASFLKDNGYLCLLTSSQWLDVEYGFRLQEWILNNFEIVAVFESIDEPWFVGARVVTAITILHHQADDKKRMHNKTRFVQLRRPIREILAHDGTTAGAVRAADQLRDEILFLKENTVNERYRARLVKQGDLWEQGVQLGIIMGKSKEVDTEDEEAQQGKYYGGKWGVHLRAPDLWFKLLDKYGEKLAPLGSIAEVRFGVKSGEDCFFFPKDCSAVCLEAQKDPAEFKNSYGAQRKEVESGKVKLVLCGEGRGEIRPIEAEYLEPEVHSLMEIDGLTVSPEDCARLILLVGKNKPELKGTYLLDYIKWGEKRSFHTGATCSARVTDDREWYDLTGHERGRLFWPMAQQYKHAIPINDHNLVCNHNLFDISPRKGSSEALAGVLNSTWVVLSKFQYGRPVGVEGNLKTEVVDVKMMLVPDPTKASKKAQEKVAKAFEKLKQRKALQFLSERRMRQMAYTKAGKEAELDKLSDECELDMPDRRDLDDAVLEMMGVRSKARRQELIDELYGYLRQFFEWTRQKEEKAIINKGIAKRRGPARPGEIASQISQWITENEGQLLRQYDSDFLDKSKPFDTFDIPAEGTAEAYSDMFTTHSVKFLKGRSNQIALIETKNPAQSDLIVLVARSGIQGLVRIPHEEDECLNVFREYDGFIRERERRLRELIAERTADEDMQEKIYDALMPLILHRNR